MNYIITVLVFCIVLFLYLHIYHHLKTSNDLEVYEIERPSKDKLEEICDLRQPVVFKYTNERLMSSCALPKVIETYGVFDVKIRNTKDDDEQTETYLPLVIREAIELVRNDKKEQYVSENNSDFLEETGLIKNYKYNDAFLRPPMVSSCNYDFLFGSKNTTTPLCYDLNYRNYYLVTNGSITIKLIAPQSSKYLYARKKYETLEFSSPVNPWDVQEEYKADFDKIKLLDVTLNPGDIIYIPAYWWYSFKYNNISSVCAFKYRTYMNTIAISPQIVLSLLQKTNIQRKTMKVKECDDIDTKVDNDIE
jgi:hypothetical protein